MGLGRRIRAISVATASVLALLASIAAAPAFAGPATHFVISTPASATAGTAFNFTIIAEDQFNNTATGYGGTVHFTTTDGQAVLPADATLSNGVGTFSATLKTAGSQTITGTDTGNSSITGTSSSITVKSAPASHFAVSAPASATAGSAFSLVVTALDPFNNTATGYPGHVHFTSTDGQAALPANSTLTNGTKTFSATLMTAGSQTITATDTVNAAITGTSNSTAVSPAAATHFAVAAPSSTTAGTGFNFTVTALDQFNNTATGYAGTVHFTSSDGSAVLPANSTLSNGTGTFTATLKTAGNRTITATDTVNSAVAGTSNPIAVSPAAATHFAVSAPAHAAVGNPFSFTVTALDQFNNKASGYGGTAHFTSNDPAAVLPANSKLSGGAATLSATLNTVGDRTITATDMANSSITGTSAGVAVAPAPTHFSVTGPSSATAGNVVTLTVTARDASDSVVTGYTGTVHFSSSDGQAALPADTTLTNGAGTFSATLRTAGSQTIVATDTRSTSLTGSVTIPVSPAAATRLSLSSPPSVAAGEPFTFSVIAFDQFGNIATGYAGHIHFTSTDGAATLPADSTFTNGTGVFSATLRTAGTRTMTATDTATSSLTSTGNPISVGPGAATRFSVSAPASATAGTAFGVTVTALDQFGNTATGYAGHVHFTSTDGLATLPADSSLAGGTGGFKVTLRSAGSRTIRVADKAVASIVGTSPAVAVHGKFLPTVRLRAKFRTTLGKHGSFVVPGVLLRCPVGAPRGCRVTGSAILAKGGAKNARRRRPQVLASVSLTFAAGRQAQIVMHLTKAGRNRLRPGASLRITAKLTASVVGGSGILIARSFTVERPRVKHRR